LQNLIGIVSEFYEASLIDNEIIRKKEERWSEKKEIIGYLSIPLINLERLVGKILSKVGFPNFNRNSFNVHLHL